jgi:methylthioribose-1-phosphate isomerase
MASDRRVTDRTTEGADIDLPSDPTRRQFFRTFGRQTAARAGTAIGAAESLRRAGSAAASEMLAYGLGDPQASAARLGQPVLTPLADERQVPAGAGFRSPYLIAGDELHILDQRGLPADQSVIACRDASEVAAAIRVGAINSGPVLGELAAYTLALAVTQARGRPRQSLQQAFGAAGNVLRAAAPGAHALASATERMEAAWTRLLSEDVDVDALAEHLRVEADAIARDAVTAHAALGRAGAKALPAPAGRPLNLLMHGDMGPLSCGLVGTGFAVIQALLAAGREVHAWVTEAAPAREGQRLSAPQLAQLDVPHTVLPDSAVAWLFDHYPIDAVLLRADRVAANGDTSSVVGSLNVARLAAVSAVPVHVCVPDSARDPLAASGSQMAPAAPALGSAGGLNAETDVVPAGLITSMFTEHGVRPAAGRE